MQGERGEDRGGARGRHRGCCAEGSGQAAGGGREQPLAAHPPGGTEAESLAPQPGRQAVEEGLLDSELVTRAEPGQDEGGNASRWRTAGRPNLPISTSPSSIPAGTAASSGLAALAGWPSDPV